MKIKYFCSLFLCSLFTVGIWADDVVVTPTKKQVLPKEIPHIWVSGDLLYWKTHEDRRVFTNRGHEFGTTGDFTTGTLVAPHAEWNPGVRLNLGYQPEEWTFYGTWTYINSRARSHKTAPSSFGLFPVWVLSDELRPTDYVTQASMRWSQSLNILEIGSSRPWLHYKNLALKPYFTLRSVSIEQTFSVQYSGGLFPVGIDRVHMSNNYWGMGPHVGIMPSMNLGQGFSLITDIAGSCFLGRFKNKQSETLLENSRFSESFRNTRVLWELNWSAALGWQTEVEYKILVIGAQIGWEWHKFYSENQLRQNHLHMPQGNKDLILNGFFASVVIGF